MTVTAPVAPPPPGEARRFGFHLPAITRVLISPWLLWKTPEVTLDAHAVNVDFGWFHSRFELADIERFELSGPFWWWRALAVRNTLFKTDMSYCTDGRGALRIFLRTQRPVHWVRHIDNVYLGVEDLEGLADELKRRGIPGEDKRTVKAPAGA